MKLYFPKIVLGSVVPKRPANPFTTKRVTLRLPALKVKLPLWKRTFKFQLPITKA